MSPLVGGLLVFAVGGTVLAGAVATVVIGDMLAGWGWWASDEREAGATPVSRSSGASVGSRASSLCDGCGQLHPAEALPLELLLAGGVEVNVGRWFGRRV